MAAYPFDLGPGCSVDGNFWRCRTLWAAIATLLLAVVAAAVISARGWIAAAPVRPHNLAAEDESARSSAASAVAAALRPPAARSSTPVPGYRRSVNVLDILHATHMARDAPEGSASRRSLEVLIERSEVEGAQRRARVQHTLKQHSTLRFGAPDAGPGQQGVSTPSPACDGYPRPLARPDEARTGTAWAPASTWMGPGPSQRYSFSPPWRWEGGDQSWSLWDKGVWPSLALLGGRPSMERRPPVHPGGPQGGGIDPRPRGPSAEPASRPSIDFCASPERGSRPLAASRSNSALSYALNPSYYTAD